MLRTEINRAFGVKGGLLDAFCVLCMEYIPWIFLEYSEYFRVGSGIYSKEVFQVFPVNFSLKKIKNLSVPREEHGIYSNPSIIGVIWNILEYRIISVTITMKISGYGR